MQSCLADWSNEPVMPVSSFGILLWAKNLESSANKTISPTMATVATIPRIP